MYTFSPEIDLIILLTIMTVGCVIIQSINHNHYLWLPGDCDAHVKAWLIHGYTGTPVFGENTSTLMFLKEEWEVPEPKRIGELTHCICFKCGKIKESENFTLETWEMVNPEDTVCYSCTPCEAREDNLD